MTGFARLTGIAADLGGGKIFSKKIKNRPHEVLLHVDGGFSSAEGNLDFACAGALDEDGEAGVALEHLKDGERLLRGGDVDGRLARIRAAHVDILYPAQTLQLLDELLDEREIACADGELDAGEGARRCLQELLLELLCRLDGCRLTRLAAREVFTVLDACPSTE